MPPAVALLARVLRRPSPGPLRRGASSAAAAAGACLYAALGVEPEASPDEIKAAFRRKVRALHPDRAGPDADPAALLAVVEAHGVLADRTRRELYDLDRRNGWTGLRGEDGAGGGAAAGAPEPEAADREDWARDVAALRRWEELSDLHPTLKALDADLRAATRTAFLGPRLEPTIDCTGGVAMPEHFEAEERTVALGPANGADGGDLLAIVHGRTVLGWVRECDVKALQEQGLMLPDGAGGGEGPGRDVEGEPLPTLVWATGGEPRRTVAVARCHRVDLNGTHPQVALEVEWPAAEGGGGEVEAFHLRVEWAPELGSHKVLTGKTGREDLAWTHTLMKFKSPFVRHIHIYDRKSGAQLASARRPTLPPAAFWLFPPRDSGFSGGSWSVECAAEPGRGAGRGFHVAAVIFAAAYDLLWRERGLDALGMFHSLRRRWGAVRERWGRKTGVVGVEGSAAR